MARPLTNRSNWWRGADEETERKAMQILTATAKLTLARFDPVSQYVTVGDLISEGWLRVMRYRPQCSPAAQAYRCMREMAARYWRLRHYGAWPHLARRIAEPDELIREGGDVLLPVEWWDAEP